jgi:hypothetical protein
MLAVGRSVEARESGRSVADGSPLAWLCYPRQREGLNMRPFAPQTLRSKARRGRLHRW